jgi:hypothetical protein
MSNQQLPTSHQARVSDALGNATIYNTVPFADGSYWTWDAHQRCSRWLGEYRLLKWPFVNLRSLQSDTSEPRNMDSYAKRWTQGAKSAWGAYGRQSSMQDASNFAPDQATLEHELIQYLLTVRLAAACRCRKRPQLELGITSC